MGNQRLLIVVFRLKTVEMFYYWSTLWFNGCIGLNTGMSFNTNFHETIAVTPSEQLMEGSHP